MQRAAKSTCLKRLARIERQVGRLTRMLADDRNCIDVVTRIGAVRAALSRVENEVLQDHVEYCVKQAISTGNRTARRRKIAEFMQALTRADR